MENKIEYYESLIGKTINILIKTQQRDLFYNGIILKVFDDCLVFEDKNINEITVAFNSIIKIENRGN